MILREPTAEIPHRYIHENQSERRRKMVYENDDKYASHGVGTAGLTTGIIGTVLGSGILNNGLGGLFGNNNQNPAANPVYQLAQKDNEIAQLRAQQYSDNKFFALSEKVAGLETKVVAIETAAPLRDKILSDSILNLQATLSRIAVPMVPNTALSPGYGPAFVGTMPPPGYVLQPIVQGGTTATPTTTNSTGN